MEAILGESKLMQNAHLAGNFEVFSTLKIPALFGLGVISFPLCWVVCQGFSKKFSGCQGGRAR